MGIGEAGAVTEEIDMCMLGVIGVVQENQHSLVKQEAMKHHGYCFKDETYLRNVSFDSGYRKTSGDSQKITITSK